VIVAIEFIDDEDRVKDSKSILCTLSVSGNIAHAVTKIRNAVDFTAGKPRIPWWRCILPILQLRMLRLRLRFHRRSCRNSS